MGNSFKKQAKAEPTPVGKGAATQPDLIQYSLSFQVHLLHLVDDKIPSKNERRRATDRIRDPSFWADYISSAMGFAIESEYAQPAPIFNLSVRFWKSKHHYVPGFYIGRVSWVAPRAPYSELRQELEWSVEDRMAQYGLSDEEEMTWTIHILSVMMRGRVDAETDLVPVYMYEPALVIN